MVGESMKTSKTCHMKEPEDGFDLAILPSRETGLPFVVFILQESVSYPRSESRLRVATGYRAQRQ